MEAEPRATLAGLWGIVDRVRDTAPQAALLPLFDAAHLAWQLGDAGTGLRAAQMFADLTAAGWRDPDRILPPWTATALLAAALFQAGETARATVLRRQAIDAARTVDPWSVDIHLLIAITAIDDLLFDTSPESNDRLHAEEQRSGGGESSDACRVRIKACRARAEGRWQAARALVARGRPLAEAGGLIAPWLGMTALSAELAALCGDEDLLRREARLLREVGSRCGDRRRLATLDRALGLHALVGGNLEEAIASLAAAADVPFLGRGLRDAVLPARVDLIEALVRTGQLAEAAQRHAQVHPLLVGMADPLATALDERAAALVTCGEEAESHYRQALAAHALAGDAFEQGRTELLLGEHLRRSRRRSEARAHLQRAVHAFDALGARPWAERASQELRAAGGRAARPVDAHPELSALTAQERAVARAVADGMTNREVAEALFLSPRTVEYHLGNVYRKLGVHGRGALARALDSADPTGPTGGPPGRIRTGRAGTSATLDPEPP